VFLTPFEFVLLSREYLKVGNFDFVFSSLGARDFVVEHLLEVHLAFFLLSAFIFIFSIRSVFIVRNTDLMIGSKRTLVIIAALAVVLAVLVGYQGAQLARDLLVGASDGQILETIQ